MSRIVHLALLIGLVWSSAAIAAGGGGQVEYRLGAGDKVKVTVFGHRDLSGEFLVGGNGTVALPLIGKVAADGLTVTEFEGSVVGALKPDYLKNPRVSVEVLNYRPFYIIGEVKKPGSYAYVSGMTVVNAIALAGGYTYRARENRIYVTRATDPESLKRPADHDTLILPGDVIEVPERYF
jgi:polysaccharide export outer membrane protein